jgi:hypothetical protein
MPPCDRTGGRTVHIFDASNRSTEIGGLILTAGVTNANFYAMVEIFVFFTSEYVLQSESGVVIEKDDSLLLPGNYYVDSPCKSLFNKPFSLANLLTDPIRINNETPLTRTISLQTGTRIEAFRNAVRLRDRRCVVTGEVVLGAQYGCWDGFEAAHIFPLAYEQHWKEQGYRHWLSIIPDTGGSINSVQNGMLLENAVHHLFDTYRFSINPDVCIL